MFTSLPSPSAGSLEIGPLRFNAYGLMIALGVVAAVWLFKKRLAQRQIGKPDDAGSIAMIAVPFGIVGARAYHVLTDWERFSGRWFDVVKIWHGGLGVWGGISVGVVVGVFAAKKRNIPIAVGLTCVAPALALAQSIGRWGNWFNQELFGRPTDLPWALQISAAKAQASGFVAGTTFHPTFLYESLGCLLICVALIKAEKRWQYRDGTLFAMYVAAYTFLRFFVESLRIDEAKNIAGLRLNQWTSIIVFVFAIGYLLATRNNSKNSEIEAVSQDFRGSQD
ncbi:MAG: prolipoprotein diacylglyceryl transferase [Acidimicrobiia bacterium]|nr:prolipoprotein diacylglyceryl transferase [Acidimicrobiia bacterium]